MISGLKLILLVVLFCTIHSGHADDQLSFLQEESNTNTGNSPFKKEVNMLTPTTYNLTITNTETEITLTIEKEGEKVIYKNQFNHSDLERTKMWVYFDKFEGVKRFLEKKINSNKYK